jgi:T3SS negative regulator,GrlR
MKDGLYKAQFQTPQGQGAGVVVLAGGKLRGGDSSIYYTGTYVIEGDKIRGQVATDAHTKLPGMVSVFGLDRVHIDLTGKVTGDSAQLTGKAREVPGISFSAVLTRIGD